MPELDGLACIERALREYPNVKFVVLSAFTDRPRIDEAFARGATAYIAKNADPEELVEGLRRAAAGESFELGVESGPAEDPDGLTEQGLQMLRAVAGGLSNEGDQQGFWVTEQTVKFHLTNIYRKLGVGNRTEADLLRVQPRHRRQLRERRHCGPRPLTPGRRRTPSVGSPPFTNETVGRAIGRECLIGARDLRKV